MSDEFKRFGVFKVPQQFGLGIGVLYRWRRITLMIGAWQFYFRWSMSAKSDKFSDYM